MHFWVSAARGARVGTAPAHLLTSAFFWPRKMGTNWFMPALVNKRFGESGMSDEDGTMVCCFDLKKSRNDWRICDEVITAKKSGAKINKIRAGEASWKFSTASATDKSVAGREEVGR